MESINLYYRTSPDCKHVHPIVLLKKDKMEITVRPKLKIKLFTGVAQVIVSMELL